jgi:hypothetical protein
VYLSVSKNEVRLGLSSPYRHNIPDQLRGMLQNSKKTVAKQLIGHITQKKNVINTQLQTRYITEGPTEGRTSNNQYQAIIINVVREGWEF